MFFEDNIVNIKDKVTYNYDILLIMVVIICLLIIYYKENFNKYYRKYIDGKFFYVSQLGDDFFYKKSIYSYSTIIPIIIISLILSLASGYIVEDIYLNSYFGDYSFSEISSWLIVAIILFIYTYIRLWGFIFIGKLFGLENKILKVIVYDFLRITIFLLLVNVFVFSIFYFFYDFEFSKKIFETNRYIIIFYRFLYFLVRVRKIKHVSLIKIILYLSITELFFSLITLLLGYDSLRFFSINRLS